MNTRTRLKVGLICFFSILIVAILKNWLPGISIELVVSACLPVLAYIFAETKRPSA